VENGLTGPGTRVDHSPVASSFQTPLPRQLCRHHEEMPQEWGIVGGGVIQGFQVFAWDNECMDGRLRMGVLKRHDFIILKDNLGGQASLDDSAENALIHVSLQGQALRLPWAEPCACPAGHHKGRPYMLIQPYYEGFRRQVRAAKALR